MLPRSWRGRVLGVAGWAWMLGGTLAFVGLPGPQARGQATALRLGPGETDQAAPPDQAAATEKTTGPARAANVAGEGIKRFAGDQVDLWTSPSRIRSKDVSWLLTLGGVTASLLLADHDIMQHNTLSPTTMKRGVDFSNYGLGALVGVGGALYLWGKKNGDDHKEEAGLLSGESALNALAIATALGYAFGRERPNVDGAQGKFFQGGKSFPSDHSAVAWSIASMIAHQYPGPMTKLFAYGLAGAVSVSRVTGNQHFPSDVFVGGALGWMIAREMYVKHHDPNLGGAPWGDGSGNSARGFSLNPKNFASTYVPLDSWVYPDLERLVALGFIHSQFMSTRPWSRYECARMVQEAGQSLQDGESSATPAGRIYEALAQEFYPEMHPDVIPSPDLRLESAYTRLLGISGKPLNDSYHFGQTLINDFGRPYQEGFDPVVGYSGWATWGRFALYNRGEFQHSPSAPAYSQDVRNLIAQVDDNPAQPATPVDTIDRYTLLDTYVLTKLSKWNFSFGKQSAWWGPNAGGSLLLSNNAEQIYMFRIRQDYYPLTLPWIFKYLGPVTGDFFMGKLSGNQFPPRPLFHGEMVVCKPTKYWEFGFSRTAEFGGVGRPITWGAVFNTYFSTKSSVYYPAWDNPGQRNGGFNFSYQVPKLRDWLTLYGNALSRDDPTPLAAFTPLRSLINPGIYISHLPHVPKLDLRAEAVTTNPPAAPNNIGRFSYYEVFYRDNYTNKNQLIGDWIGRVGTGYQGWSTYWFSPRTTLQLGYRHAQVAGTYIPHGGTLNDGSMKFNYQVGTSLTFSAFVQYEKWLMPVLAPEAKNNVTTSLQITWWPPSWGLKK